MAGGRPTKKRESLVKAICLRLMLGQSLNSICKLDLYPSKSTVFKWLLEDESFSDKYRRAREMQQEHYLDEIIEIADDGTNDWMEREAKDGSTYEVVNHEVVNRSKLRISTRQWVMERMAPRKYNPKSHEEVISDSPIGNIKIEVVGANVND